MKIIPVLDMLNGQVVRGVAGRRDEYRPVESRLCDSAEPLTVARAFRERLGLSELYLADLDGILDGRPNLETYRQLADDGFHLLIDAGFRDVEAARQARQAGATAIIVGLETSPTRVFLNELLQEVGLDSLLFSLDLKAGRPLGHLDDTTDPLAITREVVELGLNRLIVLDLSGVGVGEGIATGALCRTLLQRFPNLRLITGGGVRSVDDLKAAQALGVEGVLVASALHGGRIGRAEIEQLAAAELS